MKQIEDSNSNYIRKVKDTKPKEMELTGNKFNFQGTNLTVVTDTEKNTQLFLAIEVAKALGYSDTYDLTRYIKPKYQVKLTKSPSNGNTAKIADLRKGSVLLTEAGILPSLYVINLRES